MGTKKHANHTPTKKHSRKAKIPGAQLTPSEEPMSQDLSKYVTTTDAAEMLGVTKKHVALLLERDRLRGKKMGRDWLVYIPSINLYFQTKAPGGRPRSGDPKIEAAS